MSITIAIKAAYRDRSTQVGNSVQLSAGYSFLDLKQSSSERNSLHIRLLIVMMTIRARSSLWRDGQQPNAVRQVHNLMQRPSRGALPRRTESVTGHRR